MIVNFVFTGQKLLSNQQMVALLEKLIACLAKLV
jgi:hypothetical protein